MDVATGRAMERPSHNEGGGGDIHSIQALREQFRRQRASAMPCRGLMTRFYVYIPQPKLYLLHAQQHVGYLRSTTAVNFCSRISKICLSGLVRLAEIEILAQLHTFHATSSKQTRLISVKIYREIKLYTASLAYPRIL